MQKRQQGLAFLVLMIIMILTIVTYSFSDLSVSRIKADHDKGTLQNLKRARQALIDYAITYSDRDPDNDYGILPNPETNLNGDDGNQAATVGSKNTNLVEWLPWRSLDIAPLKDHSGTCLFYAVSGTYRSSPRADMVNEDSIGKFRVMNSANEVIAGDTIDSQVVALVIAPGAALAGQTRTPTIVDSSCGRDYGNVSAYLEGNGMYDNAVLSTVADTVDDFIHATDASSAEATPYNDKFLAITRDDIWHAIVARDDFKQDMETLTRSLTSCLAAYANLPSNVSRRLPWPAAINLGAAVEDYRDNNDYDDVNLAAEGYSGRFPFIIDSSNDAINSAALTEDTLFEITGLCDDFGLDAEGITIDLASVSSKYRKLWNNWKDHFFYVLSKEYEPDNGAAGKCGGLAPCIEVNGTAYAAAVIFSGSRLPGLSRNDRTDLTEYLEDGKATEFGSELVNRTGNRSYLYTDPQTETVNDIMYCVEDKNNPTDDLTVVECS